MSQTIAALSTAPGGAIGIIRLSGADAGALLRAVFTPAGGGDLVPRMLTYGTLTVRGENLHAERLSLDQGELCLTGEVQSLEYDDTTGARGGLFARLFR